MMRGVDKQAVLFADELVPSEKETQAAMWASAHMGFVKGAEWAAMALYDVCNSWYSHYLRKMSYPSEYSRTIAPAQMDAINSVRQELIKTFGEKLFKAKAEAEMAGK